MEGIEMGKAMLVVNFLMVNWQFILFAFIAVMGAVAALCSALAVMFLWVPGPQPEAFLEGVAAKINALAEKLRPYSRKPEKLPEGSQSPKS